MRFSRYIAAILVNLLFCSSYCYADLIRSTKIKGVDFMFCDAKSARHTEQDFSASGSGYGLRYYRENSAFWYGTRKQWELCAGSYLYDDDSRFDKHSGGFFLSGDYVPFMFTLLPGNYVNAGIFLPSFYLGVGLQGIYTNLGKTSYFERISNDQMLGLSIPETSSFHVSPIAVVGLQSRLGIIDFGTQVSIGPSYDLMQNWMDRVMTITTHVGVFLVD